MDTATLLHNFKAATRKLHDAPTFTEGGPGHEARYADAYRNLVRAGLARPLKQKYRP